MNDFREDVKKNPETLEREIDETRAEIGQTVDALTRKFSPGELVDQSLNLIRQNGREIAESLGASIKQNPLPAVLTVVGLAWLMTSNNRPVGYSSSTSSPYLSNTKEKLSSAGDSLKEKAATANERLTNAKDAVVGSLSDTASAAKSQATRARNGFNSLLQEQPLVLGALGMALGAALGAALPQTEVENRFVGAASDDTKTQLKEAGIEAYNQAHDTAKQIADAGRETVSRENEPANV